MGAAVRRALSVGAGLCLAGAVPLSAQVTVGADLGIFNTYVWRGVTYTSKPVIQPDLWISIPIGAGAFTAGGWANIELGRYDGPDDVSLGGGEGSPDVGEFDWWAEYARAFGTAEVAVGIIGYVFPNEAVLTSANNTFEVFARLGLATPLSPQLGAYYDIGKIKGFYFEGSLAHDLALSPALSLTIGAVAGLNTGQGINLDEPGEQTNFEEKGLTHVDFSLSTGFGAGPLTVSPSFHFQLNRDPYARFVSPDSPDESTLVWFGLTLSWASGGD